MNGQSQKSHWYESPIKVGPLAGLAVGIVLWILCYKPAVPGDDLHVDSSAWIFICLYSGAIVGAFISVFWTKEPLAVERFRHRQGYHDLAPIESDDENESPER